MAQLSIQAVEDLYNNLTILQFWKKKPRPSFMEYIECYKTDLRNDKSTVFLETLQFLISLSTTSKELKQKGLAKLPSSPVEQREFVNNALKFFSTTFPELNLSKSNFTGNRILETLRLISIRTLANLCREKDTTHGSASSKYDEKNRMRALKLSIANEVRKHKLLRTAAQQKRKELLTTMQKIREYLEFFIAHCENMKAGCGMPTDREFPQSNDEQVMHLMSVSITEFMEKISNELAWDCESLDSPLPLKSIDLKRYHTMVDRNILRLASQGEERNDECSDKLAKSPVNQEICATESAIYSFIQKAESIVSKSL